MTKEICITGMGIASCLGNNLEEVWGKLCNGIDGIREIDLFDTTQLRNNIGAQVEDDCFGYGEDRMLAFTKNTILRAIEDSKLSIEKINQSNSALIIGTSLGHLFENENGIVIIDDYIKKLLDEIALDIPFQVISSACSSGSDAISIGADLIKYNDVDIAICGGVDILDIYKMSGHSSLRTLSPTKCTPFDIQGDGTTLGEGAAFLILEPVSDEEYQRDRIYAKLAGSSNTTDTYSVTAPAIDGSGAIRVVEQAIEQTTFQVGDIVYMNAHGSATPTNDKMESKVYDQLFFLSQAYVSSTKGAFGHTLGATGAIEAVVAILALKKKLVPPTIGTIKVSTEWNDKNVVLLTPREIEAGYVTASVTYGFGGANACLLFSE